MQPRLLKKRSTLSALVLAGFLILTSAAQAEVTELTLPPSFTICTDTNFQFPFSFMKDQKPVGLHIDIIDAALHSLGIKPHYEPTTWSGCLDRAKAGMVDAVATAAYMDERALYMYYPSDATHDYQSSWRITEVEYKVITSLLDKKGHPNDFQFDGYIEHVPEPARVPTGYFIVHDLEKARLQVQEGPTSLANFQSLVKEKTGCVVDLPEVAQQLSLQPEFSDQFYVHQKPLVIKSYYLAFSKGGHLNLVQAQQIWDAIAKVREDKTLMAGFLKKY